MDPCHIKSKIRRANFFVPVPPNAPTTLLCEPFQWGPVWDVWSTMLIGPWNPYTDRVWTGVFFYNNCPPGHEPMPHKIENPASQFFLPVPANAPTTLLCEPFQWGPVWDVWSTMLIGPWNPYTDRVWTGVFFYNNCSPVHGPMPHEIKNPASQLFLPVPANAPTTLLCEPFQWGPVWDVWSTMLIGPWNPYTDRVWTGVFFYNNCLPVHGPMPHKIENPASQFFLPVPAHAPTTLLCEPFQWGPVWDVWSTMLIGPWNPYTDRVWTGVFFYTNCPPVHGPLPHKLDNQASQFFLPVPANAPTTLLCEPFQWGPVWDVWSTMLIGPWNPYTDRVSTWVFFYNTCPPVHGPMPHEIENPASQCFLPVPANAPTTLLCEPFQWGPVWDVWSTMLIGPWNPYTDRVWTGVFFYNTCPPVHGPMPYKIENPASQCFLPVPANAFTTLLCEPFQWGPVWDVWSTMMIAPWNPYTDRVWTGVFSTIIAHQSMDPCHIKSTIWRANFFYLCPQMHPRPYCVSHSNGAQSGMCGQPC